MRRSTIAAVLLALLAAVPGHGSAQEDVIQDMLLACQSGDMQACFLLDAARDEASSGGTYLNQSGPPSSTMQPQVGAGVDRDPLLEEMMRQHRRDTLRGEER